MADWTPQSRAEEILFKTINGDPYDGLPQSRIEELLLELKAVIESGGGGGGGTDNYNLLKNLPQINGKTIKGNMSGTTLGLVNMVMGKDLSTNDYTNTDKAIVNSVTADLADKVDKVTGKDLSTNDYTDADKAIVGGVTSALSDKVDKVTGKGLSTNDYTDADKAIVGGVTSALAGKVDTSSVGSANGVAELDVNGRVPSSQLPSYVDDVLEYADLAHFPATGETGKIYIAEDTNKTYRWSGSEFVEISESLALGETSSTAYAGNKGKANADAIAAIKDGANIDSFGDVEDAFNYLTFEGTQAEWNLLSTAEKKKYKQAIFTDDYDDNPVGNLNALNTTDKSSCVAAINEVNEKTGFQSFEVAIAGEQVKNGTAILDTNIDLTAYQPICIFEKPPQDARLSYTFNATGSLLIVKNYTTSSYTIPSNVGNISILCAKK